MAGHVPVHSSLRLARSAVDDTALESRIAGFLAGEQSLTGLELYYELERSTPLLEFHTVMRDGPRNRDHNGLQQSYGDHNRLLMLGIDKLLEGDLAWYRTRLVENAEVSDDDLLDAFASIAALGLTRDVVVALWLAAALHDCGMLCGRGASVDVEDGVVVGRELLASLCPSGLDTLAMFVLRHHDYIKAVFLGEVPAALVADDLARIEPAMASTALIGLGLVQIAGAASLGEGRLERFRMEIWRRCLDGSALIDDSPVTRLARLLAVIPQAAPPPTQGAAGALDQLTDDERQRFLRFLASVAVHRWQRVSSDLAPDERMALLVDIAGAWDGSDADHLVLEGGAVHSGSSPAFTVSRIDTALSGIRLAVLEP
jgi:hypothetical protein